MKTLAIESNDMAIETRSTIEELKLKKRLSKKEQKGLEVIRKHAGKRNVFEIYLATNPMMAEKYLEFISRNIYVRYIRWDAARQRFMVAS
jgi:hypothetical protein